MEVETEVPGLLLRTLCPEDAEPYVHLVQSSAAHLTRQGDYLEEVLLTTGDAATRFGRADNTLLGVWLHGSLIGCVHLVPIAPPSYGFGFWIAPEHAGQGLMHAACQATLQCAARQLGAEEVLAGVTHSNMRSERLLRRLGFEPFNTFETYTRFHLSLPAPGRIEEGTSPPGSVSG